MIAQKRKRSMLDRLSNEADQSKDEHEGEDVMHCG